MGTPFGEAQSPFPPLPSMVKGTVLKKSPSHSPSGPVTKVSQQSGWKGGVGSIGGDFTAPSLGSRSTKSSGLFQNQTLLLWRGKGLLIILY
jgi:hypothetical protein